ncbi:MAG: hypothetical protein LC131_01240 [Anaerolineae bacterium]|nr:hypothetical protein [Anaerolineae bacterium]HNS40151.1 hypothetical protein [Promineifilum sp.]
MSDQVRRVRHAVMWILIVSGVLLVVGSFAAELIGLDLTPGFGVLQTLAFLSGVTLLTIAIYLHLFESRPSDAPYSLQATIGTRLSLTGLVLCYVCGFADLIGIGTHVPPEFERPFIGPLQWGGLMLGLLLVLTGIILYYTSRGKRASSSLGFILNDQKE